MSSHCHTSTPDACRPRHPHRDCPFPVSLFAKARECGRCVGCSSNVKQIGLGILQYTQDNDNKMPNIYMHSPRQFLARTRCLRTSKAGLFQCPDRNQNDPDANAVGWTAFQKVTQPTTLATTGEHIQIRDAAHLPAPAQSRLHLKTLLILLNSSHSWKPPTTPVQTTTLTMPRGSARPAAVCGPGTTAQAGICLWMGMSNNYGPLRHTGPPATLSRNLWYRNGTQPLSANGVAVLQDAQQRFQP